jgi:hypothetical protein
MSHLIFFRTDTMVSVPGGSTTVSLALLGLVIGVETV